MPSVKTVAIVDDDESVRNAIGCLVRSMGMESWIYSSVDEFLDAGAASQADCLISDVHMPGLNGADLQQHLINNGNKLPVIFVTAFPDPHVRQRALSNGAVCFLTKPFDATALIACIEMALAHERV